MFRAVFYLPYETALLGMVSCAAPSKSRERRFSFSLRYRVTLASGSNQEIKKGVPPPTLSTITTALKKGYSTFFWPNLVVTDGALQLKKNSRSLCCNGN